MARDHGVPIMKYFLTGATGFLGGVLARQLRGAGYDVNAVIRSPEKASELRSLGVTLFKGDVTDKESMREAMQGTDGVFHVAGWYKIGAKDKSPGEKVNVQGTRNILELMQELRIPKGVYTSTLAINSDTHGELKTETYHFTGKHISEYDRTKARDCQGIHRQGFAARDRHAGRDLWSRRYFRFATNTDRLSSKPAPDASIESWHHMGACGGYCPWTHFGYGKGCPWRNVYNRRRACYLSGSLSTCQPYYR
jgi:hypothetical protein